MPKRTQDAPTWRAKVQQMPQFGHYELRAAQFDAVANIEKSLAAQTHSRSLVQMATGAGKTRMAVTESYRLIKYGGVDRVLFLVDRNNLADQTLREFRDYATPDDGRRFTDLYNVDKLTSAGMIGSSKVVISTIQRVFSVLRGNEVAEDDDPDVDEFTPDAPVEADYSPSLPPEAFDLIIVDECHRSIYGVWRSVLEYFDAHILGLTATPASAALSRRNSNSKSYTSIVVRRLRFLPSDLAGVVHIGSSRSYQITSRSLPMMPPREVGAAQPWA